MSKKEMNVLFIHHNRLEQMSQFLTDEEIGSIIRALYNYDRTGEETIFDDRAISMQFIGLKYDVDENRKKYKETCKKREEAIRKRWEKEQMEQCVEAPEKIKKLINKIG